MKFNNFAIIGVDRKEGASFLLDKTGDKIQNKQQAYLIDALPLGKIPPLTIKQLLFKSPNLTLLSFTKELKKHPKLDAIALILEYSNLPSNSHELCTRNPFGLINSVEHFIEEYLKKNSFIEKEVTLEVTSPEIEDLAKYDKLDTAAAAMLTLSPTIIIGNYNLRIKFLASVEELLPPELVSRVQFTTYSESIASEIAGVHPVVDIAGCDAKKENYQAIDAIIKEKLPITVIDTDSKVCYGPLTTPITKKMHELLKQGKIKEIKEHISQLYKLAVASDYIADAKQFATENDISYADAMLVLNLRATHFNLPRPKDISGAS